MIKGEDIERAERILKITYTENHAPTQLRQMKVEIEDFNTWLIARTDRLQSGLPIQWRRVDPRIHQMYNTLLMHFFLVGLVIGRGESTGGIQ